MTSLQTDSPQQIFLVTYLMIVPSSPYNLIIIAISNSNLSDCSFQLLLPVITFSHTAISLEFSPCKRLEPCEPVMSQTSLREINTKCPTARYFFQPPSNFYASPPPFSICFTLLKMHLSKLHYAQRSSVISLLRGTSHVLGEKHFSIITASV